MKIYRATTLTTLACAAGLSLAACAGSASSALQTTASTTSPASAAGSSATASAPSSTSIASASKPSSGPGGAVSVGGDIGSFPIPPGAAVVVDNELSGQYHVAFSGVTASAASSFYTTALPRAGYTITQNSTWTGDSYTGTAIVFSGHGCTGSIGAWSGGLTYGGGVIGITFVPQ